MPRTYVPRTPRPRRFTCQVCKREGKTKPGQPGPLPQYHPECKQGFVVKPDRPPTAPGGVSSTSVAFSAASAVASIPVPVPSPAPGPPAPPAELARPVQPPVPPVPAAPGPVEPGPLESALRVELAGRTGFLVEIALATAQAADQVPSFKLKDKLSALKALTEIRAQVLAPTTAAEQAEQDVAEPQVEQGLFGAVRAELAPEVDLGVCRPRWATRRR